MKFPNFDYVAAKSMGEALEALSSDPDARILAGGQSLLPLMALRLSAPTILVDLERVDGLAGIDDGPSDVRLGAMVRQRDGEASRVVRQRLPLLAAALGHVAHPAVRNRGTIGGSLAHADPAAELPVAMVALGATLVAVGPAGERTIPAADFFQGYFTSALRPGEILTRIDVPVPDEPWRWAFCEYARRHGDFALAIAAVGLSGAAGDPAASEARVVLGAVGGTPLRATAAEGLLTAGPIDRAVADGAGRQAAEGLSPPDDATAPASYRTHLASVLVRRAALQAAGVAA